MVTSDLETTRRPIVRSPSNVVVRLPAILELVNWTTESGKRSLPSRVELFELKFAPSQLELLFPVQLTKAVAKVDVSWIVLPVLKNSKLYRSVLIPSAVPKVKESLKALAEVMSVHVCELLEV